MKIRRIEITGFRGARFPLSIDFTGTYKSLSVFGDNASGKSTITDAIEWFVTSRVAHLWREDCKEDSLRNILIDDADISEVRIEFSDGTTNTKQLDRALFVSNMNRTADVQKLVEGLRKDRILLRHAQITNFIQQSKSEKRKAIAEIIGYDAFSEFRGVIQSTMNALQKDRQYAAAKHRLEEEKRTLLQLAGRLITTPHILYDQMNAELKKAGFEFTVTDKHSFLTIDSDLRARINQQERVERKLLLDNAIKDLAALSNIVATLQESEVSVNKYTTLVSDRKRLGQIHLGNLLRAGALVIDQGYAPDHACPFCLSDYDLEELRSQVQLRLQELASLTENLRAATIDAEGLIANVGRLNAACENLVAKYSQLDALKPLCTIAGHWITNNASLPTELTTRLQNYESMQFSEHIKAQLLTIDRIVTEANPRVRAESESLTFTDHETNIINLISKLRQLRETFYHYDVCSKTISLFETQIASLAGVFERFVEVQNSSLQAILDAISEPVGKFYSALHPDEAVDRVRLRMVGDEGVEFEYYFHGVSTHPPMKYLSESHLNSLGVVLFLASAKLFNTQSNFLVLDDIVTSFDVNHRRRLLGLLRDEFADWQIILLTHEAFWFDMIKRELGPQGWIVLEVICDDDNGIQIEQSAKDLKALIISKRRQYDVSNDLRKLLEATLKEICVNCEVKLAFRYNDQNERRMSGELLSALRSTVNRKCAELKAHPIFSQLEGSNLVVTIGSHDNPEKIAGGDIDVALADTDALTQLFSCSKCGRYVEAKNAMAATSKITCKCGSKELDWK